MSQTRNPELADQVYAVIRHYIEERGLQRPDGELDLSLEFTDYGLDSLDAFAIFAELEDHFNLTLDRDKALKAKQFDDLLALVGSAQEMIHH
ncbi:hypothetical protein MNBD_GAMMA12-2572 [hydrothermal vent metagenome]|uniref:Carrier domain-containing protein n=1 Tax=hydrothermal vent metagenome TaxID=652676 RepID=A0A3B0YL12_9ZZZZ